MFVYNITNKVDHSILDEWIKWQLEEHIPGIMATNLFIDFKFYQLLDQDESDGETYVIQYFTDRKENYEEYIRQYAPAFREKAIKKWNDGFIAFRSLLQSVQ
jgi:hypothetical protein